MLSLSQNPRVFYCCCLQQLLITLLNEQLCSISGICIAHGYITSQEKFHTSFVIKLRLPKLKSTGVAYKLWITDLFLTEEISTI
jgi:hypothetical protein